MNIEFKVEAGCILLYPASIIFKINEYAESNEVVIMLPICKIEIFKADTSIYSGPFYWKKEKKKERKKRRAKELCA